MLQKSVFLFCLLVVVHSESLNPCRGAYHSTASGQIHQVPVHRLTETGAVQNFAGCHTSLPRQCYLGDCIDTGCWRNLPRTQGEEGTVYYVESPYMTPCLHGLGSCVRGTCVETEDAKKYEKSELPMNDIPFTVPADTQSTSSFETCAQNPDCLDMWNAACSPIEDKPAHLGEEIPTYGCAPMRIHRWKPQTSVIYIRFFVIDGMPCYGSDDDDESEEGECYGGRCFVSDFPPYCPWDKLETGEEQLPGCSGLPPNGARLF